MTARMPCDGFQAYTSSNSISASAEKAIDNFLKRRTYGACRAGVDCPLLMSSLQVT